MSGSQPSPTAGGRRSGRVAAASVPVSDGWRGDGTGHADGGTVTMRADERWRGRPWRRTTIVGQTYSSGSSSFEVLVGGLGLALAPGEQQPADEQHDAGHRRTRARRARQGDAGHVLVGDDVARDRGRTTRRRPR